MASLINSAPKSVQRYFFEFFMLFAAVSLGFYADSVREELENSGRERKYVASILQDLRNDTLQCSDLIPRFEWKNAGLDSLLGTFDLRSANSFAPGADRLLQRHLTGFPDFVYSDGTIQQLRNAGGFLLLRDQETVKRILAYDAAVQHELLHQQAMNDYLLARLWVRKAEALHLQELRLRSETDRPSAVPFVLYTTATEHIRFHNDVVNYKNLIAMQSRLLADVQRRAEELLRFLHERYPGV